MAEYWMLTALCRMWLGEDADVSPGVPALLFLFWRCDCSSLILQAAASSRTCTRRSLEQGSGPAVPARAGSAGRGQEVPAQSRRPAERSPERRPPAAALTRPWLPSSPGGSVILPRCWCTEAARGSVPKGSQAKVQLSVSRADPSPQGSASSAPRSASPGRAQG